MTDLETQLRATLAERANEAPRGGPLAERILTEVSSPVPVLRPRRSWRTWSLPLLAAAAVASVVATVVGIDHMHSTASGNGPGIDRSGSPGPSASVHSSTAPKPKSSHSSKPPNPVVPPPSKVDPNGVTGFRVMDLTFYGEKYGWAIGTANCVSGPGLCTALFRTTDGSTWASIPGAEFHVPMPNDACTAPCVLHIRFANPSVGYAFGPAALFMTTDGGAHWVRQPGRGAEALETFNDNVIRVVSTHYGCPGPCSLHVETSAIGSRTWQTVALGQNQINANGVQLSRTGSDAYVLLTQNTAGGSQSATSTLYISTDNGASWTARAEPCPNKSSEVDSVAVAASPSGVAVVCEPRGADGASFVELSKDAGVTFTMTHGLVPAWSPVQFAGDPATELLYGGDGIPTYRSTDGAQSWQQIPKLRHAIWLGFESSSLGRAVSGAGRVVWTTRDGGHSWTPFRFG